MRILITDAGTHIRIMDTDRPFTSARRSTGTAVIAFTIRESTGDTITGAGTKPRAAKIFQGRRVNSRRLYFFGEPEAAGADVDVTDGEAS